jgi:hypothetical protein
MAVTTITPVGKEDTFEHVSVHDNPEKDLVSGVDQFGAKSKTDPREIALVRKLDIYIMVCICLEVERISMY